MASTKQFDKIENIVNSNDLNPLSFSFSYSEKIDALKKARYFSKLNKQLYSDNETVTRLVLKTTDGLKEFNVIAKKERTLNFFISIVLIDRLYLDYIQAKQLVSLIE